MTTQVNGLNIFYREAGAPHEIDLHHQGGTAGYGEREWIATPDGTQTVVNDQAFAWNPSIRGGKAEDTVILSDGAIEVITSTPDLPVIETAIDGKTYLSAGVWQP